MSKDRVGREKKKPRTRERGGWCTGNMWSATPKKVRCPECGRILSLHPQFDDGGNWDPQPGDGQRAIDMYGVEHAEGWVMYRHKRSKLK